MEYSCKAFMLLDVQVLQAGDGHPNRPKNIISHQVLF